MFLRASHTRVKAPSQNCDGPSELGSPHPPRHPLIRYNRFSRTTGLEQSWHRQSGRTSATRPYCRPHSSQTAREDAWYSPPPKPLERLLTDFERPAGLAVSHTHADATSTAAREATESSVRGFIRGPRREHSQRHQRYHASTRPGYSADSTRPPSPRCRRPPPTPRHTRRIRRTPRRWAGSRRRYDLSTATGACTPCTASQDGFRCPERRRRLTRGRTPRNGVLASCGRTWHESG